MKEIWKDIPGYKGSYQASNLGRIRSLNRVVNGKFGPINLKGKILKPRKHQHGHLSVALCKEGLVTPLHVHRLVLLAFKGPAKSGQECRHLNGQPDDNRIQNLKWGTRNENMQDKSKHGTQYRGGSNHKVVRRSDGKIFESIEEAARQTPKAHSQNIALACKGFRYKTVGGFKWKYVEN